MLNNSNICLLAFTTSSRQPRLRAETCSVTTAPSPELSIIGTSFRSKTIRPFLAQASRIVSSIDAHSRSSAARSIPPPYNPPTLYFAREIPLPNSLNHFPPSYPLSTALFSLATQLVVPHFRQFAQSLATF